MQGARKRASLPDLRADLLVAVEKIDDGSREFDVGSYDSQWRKEDRLETSECYPVTKIGFANLRQFAMETI